MTATANRDDRLAAGVVGVGSMGRHHARVYRELDGVRLACVTDADVGRASEVATEYDVPAVDRDGLLAEVDLVSVAVPTQYHYEVTRAAVDAGVHVLVEKPFVSDPDRGWELVDQADAAGLVLGVGHVERFNPAVRTAIDVVDGLNPIAVTARRLGPPLDRHSGTDVALDLMIHDIDVVGSLLGGDPRVVSAAGARENRYVTATVDFDGVVADFTASRVTQRRVRKLSVTARECEVTVDYLDQSVRIHRRSTPKYVETDGNVRYRNESVTEHPTVDGQEPLKAELRAFVEAVQTGTDHAVTGADGIRAVEVADEVATLAGGRPEEVVR